METTARDEESENFGRASLEKTLKGVQGEITHDAARSFRTQGLTKGEAANIVMCVE